MSMLTANPLPRSSTSWRGFLLLLLLAPLPCRPLLSASFLHLVGVLPPTRDGRGVLFLPSSILASNASWWGFCTATHPFPLYVANATSTPPSSTPGPRGYPSCRELFGSLAQCYLLTHPKREWRIFFISLWRSALTNWSLHPKT